MNQAKSSNAISWFALQIRSRWENSTAELLRSKGVETLLPTYTTRRKWSDRIKLVESPLFPGYLFCRFNVNNRLPVLVTPGVLSIVGRGKTPMPVEDAEIESIQAALGSGVHIEPWPYVEIGQRVRVRQDVLDGLEGILTSFKGSHRVIISVTLLRRSVALEIDRERIVPIAVEPVRATKKPVVELATLGA